MDLIFQENVVLNDWQKFFDSYADKYDKECFVQNTDTELSFLVDQLQSPSDGRILDVGCGTGRHSVGLAKVGYEVTGVDLSSGMLEQSSARAEAAGVSVEWVHSNAVDFIRVDYYDSAICLCEGAMCLLGADDDAFRRDMQILGNIFTSLRSGGRFILNVLNACRLIRQYTDEDIESGKFDILTLTERSIAGDLVKTDGDPLRARERGYTAPELRRMLECAGFKVNGIYGGTAGDWGLRVPKLDEYELMAITEKP